MQVLHPEADLESFFATLRTASARVLFVDYDGTLAPFHRRPEHAVPYEGVTPLMRAITVARTRVVMVTGRRFADLRGPMNWIAHSEVWAAHGWERSTAWGDRVHYEPPTAARRQLHWAETLARPLEVHGARVERKPASVAVHWRGLSEAVTARVRDAVASAWSPIGPEHVEMLPFDGGIELRALGRSKGDAVREVLEETGAAASCAYLGDDITDEDAFAALRGHGLSVLVRDTLRPTGADAWLRPPLELMAFLERWRDATQPA